MPTKKKRRRRTPIQVGLQKILHGIRLGDLFDDLQTLTLTLIDKTSGTAGVIVRLDRTNKERHTLEIEVLTEDGGDLSFYFDPATYEVRTIQKREAVFVPEAPIRPFLATIDRISSLGSGRKDCADRFWYEDGQLYTMPDFDHQIAPMLKWLAASLKRGPWKVAGLSVALDRGLV